MAGIIGKVSKATYTGQFKEPRKEANAAPLSVLDDVETLIAKYRGAPAEVRAGIQVALLASVSLAAALSMIPFESNFASEYAGRVLDRLVSPGVEVAINAPTRDYLENLFPTGELNARMLVTGVERAALTEDELIDTAVDAGYKDKEIKKLIRIARAQRFDRQTADAYGMLDRYQDAVITATIAVKRAEIDEQIAAKQAEIKDLNAWIRAQALAAVAAEEVV